MLADGVVLWRAWALCRDEYALQLALPAFFFGLTCSMRAATRCRTMIGLAAVTVPATIGIRLATNVAMARGLVVTAGFIDLHSHGQDPENYAFKARDGVTTALEMEVGVSPVAAWYAAREGAAIVNFGASSGHIPARMAVMRDSGVLLPRDTAAELVATAEEHAQTIELVRQQLPLL